ncbi:MAG: DMT family transporter [Coriobacteriia bacterium]|nr:DMT family transporter [Coriobacteriia bacterium]
MSRRWSLVAVVVSAACFGTLAILTPLAYDSGALPLPLLAWRFVIAAALLATVAQIRDPGSLRVPAGDVGRFAALALTGYGAASVCFFFALLYADAAVVAVLLYAYPAFVTIAGWAFLGERPTRAATLAVCATFAGCALVLGVGSGDIYASLPGILLGLGAAVGYTLFNLLSHRWLPGRSRLTMMAYTFGIAAVLPAALAVGGGGLAALSTSEWSTITWALLAAIVLVPTFAAIVLYLEGIRGLGPSQAAVVSTLEPIFTIVLARVFLPEQSALEPLQLVGVALVIGGVVVAEIGARATIEPAPV